MGYAPPSGSANPSYLRCSARSALLNSVHAFALLTSAFFASLRLCVILFLLNSLNIMAMLRPFDCAQDYAMATPPAEESASLRSAARGEKKVVTLRRFTPRVSTATPPNFINTPCATLAKLVCRQDVAPGSGLRSCVVKVWHPRRDD